MKKSWFRRIVSCVLLIVCVTMFFPVPGRAEKCRQRIKVGYYESENFQKGKSDKEPKSGYSYEYLQKIAYYTGWSYEYVYGDWSELYDMFVEGKIDLMAGLSQTEEREGKMLFPKQEMGAENYFLYTDEERFFDGNKRQNWDGKRIGVIENSLMTSCVMEWARENQISPKLIYFSDFGKRDKAFAERRIDVIASTDNSITSESGLSMVAKVGESPFYLAVSTKQPELLEELNLALEKIQMGGYSFNQSLEKTYFSNTLRRKLSEDEEEWVKNHSLLVVGYMDNFLPFCGEDKNGNATGVMTEIFDEIWSRFHLKDRVKIRYVSYKDQGELYDAVNEGKVDVAFPIYLDIWNSEQNNLFQMDSIAASGIDIIFREDYTAETDKKIAINRNNRMMQEFVKKCYPSSEIHLYDSVEECLDAVLNGKVSSTLINGYRTNGILNEKMSAALNVAAVPQQFSMGMGVKKGESKLVSLLNHGLGLLDSDFVYLRTYRYGVKERGQNVEDIIQKYIVTILITLLVILGLSVFIIIVSNLYRKAVDAERELKDATYTKQTVLYSLGAAIWTMRCHPDGTITEFQNSEELRKMLGYTKEEYPDDMEFAKENIHPDDWPNIVEEDVKICKDFSETFDTQWRVRMKSGEYKWFRAVGRIAEGTDGLFYGALLDVDEQRQAELQAEEARKEKAKLEEAMNAVYRALGSAQWQRDFDREGNLTGIHLSREFIRLHGYDSYEKAPQTSEEWLEVVHPEDRDAVEKFFMVPGNRTEDNAPLSMIYRVKGPSGEYRYLKSSGQSVFRADGTVKSVYGAVMDVHEQEMAHQSMMKAIELAESANKAKTAFLFNMSHDIRTPMNAIIGFAELMELHWGDDNLTKGYLKKLKSASEFLLSLINNVLELARIESGKMTLDEKPCRMDAVVDDICNVMEGTFKKNGQQFKKELNLSHATVYADETKLREILLNVLSNAAKYTPEGGCITYTVTEEPKEEDGVVWVISTITDTGIGMSEEFLPHVFEEFSREETTANNPVVGTGLGMPIVKQLVERMQGTIEVESKLGAGSTFRILIPHRIADDITRDDNAQLTKEQMREMFADKRVLLAEDNPLNAEIAKAILRDKGFLVEHVKDGEECLKRVQEADARYFDVILMDIHMPKMNGYEATRAIRKLEDEEKANIPIFAVTANAFEEDKKEAMAAGMNGHLVKPLDVKRMMQTLAELFERE